jgi:hypothetical protein
MPRLVDLGDAVEADEQCRHDFPHGADLPQCRLALEGIWAMTYPEADMT